MTPFRNQLKTPEEIELDRKRVELARLKELHAVREAEFTTLKAEIRIFEQTYAAVLGDRIALLEDLEWQLNGLLDAGNISEPVTSPSSTDAFSYFHHRTDLLDDDGESDPDPKAPPRNIKALYRAVAKAIHPDLASSDGDRRRRQELMVAANRAYAAGDRRTLEDIFMDCDQGTEPVTELDVALELVRVIREIARIHQNVHAIACQSDELKATDIYQFKLRVDESLADGVDLLAEMSAALDIDILKAKNRLAVLRGETSSGDTRTAAPLETRIIRFPSDTVCGTLFERSRTSLDFRDWRRIGIARGSREVFLDKAVRLDVKAGPVGIKLDFLGELKGNDLQSLFLYDADDAALSHLGHLDGLDELYISNSMVSDTGLWQLRTLKWLKRLYVYHTTLTDDGLLNLVHLTGLQSLTCSGTDATEEGLSRLRRLMPYCKISNFKWRYDQ